MAIAKTPQVPVSRPYDNRFEVSSTTYPDNLLSSSNEYGGNYVMFRIYTHQDSKLIKENPDEYFTSADNSYPLKRGWVAGINADTAKYFPEATTATAIGATKVLTNPSKLSVTNVLLGAGGTYLGGQAFENAVGNVKKDYKLQKKAICLYMPAGLTSRYSVTWNTDALGTVAAFTALAENLPDVAQVMRGIASGEGLSDMIKKATGLETGSTSQNVQNIKSSVSSIGTAQLLKTPGFGQMLSKASGIAANPKKEQLFKEVEYRTFTFAYSFYPRSKQEAATVREIIKEFKLHMHPEFKDAGEFLYIYPSEFEIVYYNNGKENTNLHKHTACVLTDMNISYSPQNVYTSFDDGMPSQINVQLSFRELALLSKKDIQEGY